MIVVPDISQVGFLNGVKFENAKKWLNSINRKELSTKRSRRLMPLYTWRLLSSSQHMILMVRDGP